MNKSRRLAAKTQKDWKNKEKRNYSFGLFILFAQIKKKMNVAIRDFLSNPLQNPLYKRITNIQGFEDVIRMMQLDN